MFERNYYRFRLLFDVLAGVGAGMLWTLAPLIVEIVFDDRYVRVAPFLQVLGLGLMLSGPLILRQALGAERDFRTMTVLSAVTSATLWIGLLVVLFVFGSIEAALLVIVLHRLPEALLLLRIGARRGWIRPLREATPLLFFVVGTGVGRGALWIIDALA